ncbi:cell wall hydrolase [Parafrankia colletiae]|uniref:Cell wall hydrolase n=1 Tax=Parafrankia colletiae TaxID=573497 RepID=A0A1S1RAM8_9ACTN|nr:N-acetylmuramoyl-L-alanine amidase [Parafrankia colletiae]MCK9900822.1 N-acetylmuramoyl-L-alanine amidase [Frankia sp. Cpl3]OHV43240.1 cell wall hydrolase [Parafrankia colletiae]
MPRSTPRRVSPYALLAAAAVLAIAVAVTGMVIWPGGTESDGARRPAAGVTAEADPRALAGRTVVIDPGHNGGNSADPRAINRLVDAGGFRKECDTVGAETTDGYAEHAFTFDVAVRAAEELRARGATVILTRNDDQGVGPCVDERARIGNEAGADAVVSLHADGGPPQGSGFHVIAPAASPDGGNDGILPASGRLANLLREAFGSATGQPPADYLGEDGITVRADLGGLNLSRVPKVFLECGNMRNPGDAARISDPAWRQQAAAGLVQGLVAFLTDGGPRDGGTARAGGGGGSSGASASPGS